MGNLKKRCFPQIDEIFYFNTLDNGLKVFLIPKKGYQENLAMMTVKYGAVDTEFTLNNDDKKVYPAGLAHFLEHQFFEREDKEDLSKQLTRLNADSNAFTTHQETSYYFSASGQFSQSLNILQKAFKSTHLTELSIKKEKGIIKQEIDMYQDDPDYKLFLGVLGNLYPDTPLAQDIAGDRYSLAEICKEDLEDNFTYFYHPSNRSLLVIGDFDVKQVYKDIVATERQFPIERSARIERSELSLNPIQEKGSLQMEVALPKLALGFRLRGLSSQSLLKEKLVIRLLFQLLFGWTSSNFQTWYEEGRVDDSFDIDIEVSTYCQFVIVSMDTKEPIAMASKIKHSLKHFTKSQDFTKERFELLKKELFGEFLKSLDSLDSLAVEFMNHLNGKETYFHYPDILSDLSFESVIEMGHYFNRASDISEFTIFPK